MLDSLSYYLFSLRIAFVSLSCFPSFLRSNGQIPQAAKLHSFFVNIVNRPPSGTYRYRAVKLRQKRLLEVPNYGKLYESPVEATTPRLYHQTLCLVCFIITLREAVL